MPDASEPTPDLFRRACGQFATGVCILTTLDSAGSPHGLTVNSFTSLSLDPPLVLAAIARSSAQLAIFESTSHFGINILAASQRDLSDRFARRIENRFDGVEWTAGAAGIPLFAESLAMLECQTRDIIDAGDHRIFVGEVIAITLNQPDRPALMYFRGRYAESA